MADLLDPERARELVLERCTVLPAEEVPLVRALGRVLADDVASREDVPGFDNSAMDGFAVRSADTQADTQKAEDVEGGQRVRLAIAGESRAGRPASVAVGPGQAVRISTGAMLPAGSDAVLRKEDADDLGNSVEVLVAVPPGKEVRRAGEDLRAGERALERGAHIGPAELGVLASVGVDPVPCTRMPTVAVLATGDELVEPGRPLGPGQIRNTNAFSVPALAERAGAAVASARTVADDHQATVEAIEAALACDVVVLCGGVSVGEHDHVKPALEQLGVERVFWGVALRPGHPTLFGTLEKASPEGATTLVFGLPGNPVSAMVTFHLFVRPALAALAGASESSRTATAVIDEPYAKRPGRAHVLRCRLEARDDGWHVRPTKAQGSHVLSSMVGAEAFAYLDVDRSDVAAGERVPIELLEK